MKKTCRQIAREKATIGVYQNLVVNASFDEIKDFIIEEEVLADNEKYLNFSYWLVKTTILNKESYQKLIESHLKKGWTFDRLNMMERAILLIATCELLESDLPKTIIINEAVLNAKLFCDDDSYKFINGVLSQLV